MYIEIEDYLKSKRIPLNATFQLTYRCNFKCLHCYLTPSRKEKLDEISLNDGIKIIDTLKEKGCIFITFIGGEVLLSKNFPYLYKYAYEKNLKITVSTNGSLINSEYIDLFSKYKPLKISITLYGMCNDTYKKFTKVSNGFDLVKNNIDQLVKNNIRVNLKTVANIINRNEILAMKDFADNLGVPFEFYYKMSCFVDGNKFPLSLQLPTKDIVPLIEKLGIKEKYLEYINHPEYLWKDGIKICGAGRNQIYIDPEGNSFLCNNSNKNKWSILKYGFDYCWEMIGEERKKEIDVITECGKCSEKFSCGICAPYIKREYGSLCRPYNHCKQGKLLEEMLLKDNE